MKIQIQKSRHERGTVLAITLVICGIVGIFTGSFLIIVESQHLSVARAQAWSSAIAVAEAGVEEAMAHLNSGVALNNLGVNTWSDVGGGNFRKTNVLGTSYS